VTIAEYAGEIVPVRVRATAPLAEVGVDHWRAAGEVLEVLHDYGSGGVVARADDGAQWWLSLGGYEVIKHRLRDPDRCACCGAPSEPPRDCLPCAIWALAEGWRCLLRRDRLSGAAVAVAPGRATVDGEPVSDRLAVASPERFVEGLRA
jgi:hypothetical protein